MGTLNTGGGQRCRSPSVNGQQHAVALSFQPVRHVYSRQTLPATGARETSRLGLQHLNWQIAGPQWTSTAGMGVRCNRRPQGPPRAAATALEVDSPHPDFNNSHSIYLEAKQDGKVVQGMDAQKPALAIVIAKYTHAASPMRAPPRGTSRTHWHLATSPACPGSAGVPTLLSGPSRWGG